MFSGDKDDCVDVWIVIVTIKTDQMYIAFNFHKAWAKYKTIFVPKVWVFFRILLVDDFTPSGQTWYTQNL